MKNRRKSWERGSFTVEATLIFPVILFTVLGLFYLGIVQYQNVTTATAAMRTASRVSYAWNVLGGEGAWGFQAQGTSDGTIQDGQLVSPNYGQHDPYRHFFDSRNTNREANGLAYMQFLMGKSPNLMGENEITGAPTVQKTGGLLQQYVEVTVEKTYINPLGNLAEGLGFAPREAHTITAKAPLVDPGEFIRNASFIFDLATKRAG